jgi:hypothetical protein
MRIKWRSDMIMKKGMVALTAATALGLAVTAAPKPADAAWWVAPAIVAGVVGGVALGAAANNAYAANAYYGGPYYDGPGAVYVAPTATCRWVQVRHGGRIYRERHCG